ncbi:MAG: DUF3617 domain-containing protein [Pseudomonadota bacterium]
MPIKLSLLVALLTLSAFSNAEGLTIKPGLWETTMTRTNPMTGQPQTDTTRECVTQTSFDPASLMQGAEGCRMLKNDLTSNALDFSMSCSMQGATTTVVGRYEVDGDSGKGNMEMNMSMGEMKMSMKMDWTASRIGDC